MNMQAKRAGEAGFNLIELMIVITIIGILAAVFLPRYEHHVVTARAAKISQEFHQVITQTMSAMAAASAGQTTNIVPPSTMPGGYSITVNPQEIGPRALTTSVWVTVTLRPGSSSSSSLNAAVAGAVGAMASACGKSSGNCVAAISPKGNLTFTH